ncbi:dUTP diphosphatase [Candidatus Cyanaurora vandensis]|uniref:dUTP diphosphatase n=1 Tax=Candidatus Cyanaurora vandensis TaxID=2714958 RepID=UPI00257C9D85|nr:dUTP diphosphatase [Candidatus Cyanaurora vandensis]
MELQIQRCHPDARLPHYAHPGDAGLDLYAVEKVLLKPGRRALVSTGIALALPPNTEAQVRPRSGLALNHGITVLNSPGTVDEQYRGVVGVILINLSDQDFLVTVGMKIAQLVVQPVLRVQVQVVKELPPSVRGTGGFGSTG